ncbi:MAG: pyridoxamine 5'-phosphate oxidase family protein [Lachnospiraceae bacterium]|nr:pyridoxamine 5'-phosphate oxidase family protein [Lachnospiraceae bacterium]
MRDAEKTIGNMIDKQNICYISSVDEDGFPNTKAMLKPRKRNGINEIYLTTNTSSLKVKSFKNNSKACLYFCDRRFFRGIMLKGTVEILEDQESKDMIWQSGDEMYYPKGKTDPDYCVIKFTTISARYYSNYKSEDVEI